MPSILSAPAAMPATNELIFAPALAPLSAPVLATVTICWANWASPACCAKRMTGTNPAEDTRLGSSNEYDTAASVWLNSIYEVRLSDGKYWLQHLLFSHVKDASLR